MVHPTAHLEYRVVGPENTNYPLWRGSVGYIDLGSALYTIN